MTAANKPASRRSLRAILQGTSLIALALAAPLHAQDGAPTVDAQEISESRYFLQLMSQTFDGYEERSHTQTASFGRLRRGDESWVMIDYGDGAMAVETIGNLEVGNFENTTPTEIALLYDYRTNELSGNSATSAYHNTYIRPLLNRAPSLGSDASWQMRISPEQLGVEGVAGEAFLVNFRRTYFTHQGKPVVLIEYDAPAFTYSGADGQTVVHWAKGAALADPGFGEIYWNASLHRAAASDEGQETRPYRLARTTVAVGADGEPLLDPATVPELAAVMQEYYSETATAPLPTITTPGRMPDQSPLQLAARIDIAASTILENSANQLGEALGTYLSGETGVYVSGRIIEGLQSQEAQVNFAAANDSLGWVALPDKILDSLRTLDLSSETMANAGISLTDFDRLSAEAQVLVSQGNGLKDRASNLGASYRAISQEARLLEAQLEAGMQGASSYAEFMDNPTTGRIFRRLAELEQGAKTTIDNISQLQTDMITNTNARSAIGRRMDDLEALARRLSGSGLGQQAGKLFEAIEKYKLVEPIKGLVGAFDVAGYYSTAQNMGNISDLDERYSTNGKIISGVVFDILGIGTAAFEGNAALAWADAIMVGTSRAGDIYFAYQAYEQSELDQQTAHMQHLLTIMRSSKFSPKITAELDASFKEMHEDLAEIAAAIGPNQRGSNGPINTSDPRFDPVTGLPKSLAYWEWLKINDRAKLIERGINPDAPAGHTGPWPPVVAANPRPGPISPPPSINDGGPNYPTAPQRTPISTPRPVDSTMPPPSVLSDEQLAAIERERRRQQSQDELDAYQAELLTNRSEGSDRFALSAQTPFLSDQATSLLTVSEFNSKPVTFKPVTWTPVTFEPVTFEPVTWKPPTWTPPEFHLDNPSDIPWTDFDDGEQWGGGIQNLAFDYSGMSGKVATDLQPYEEWLATQNVSQLERLALQAGYPNLASALADYENLIRQAEDSGWRAWAMAAPSCNGPAGCGPQYLERWAAKRSRLALGDILQMDRDFFSSAGLSDVEIAGLFLAFTIFDFGVQDNDVVTVTVNQFGQTLLNQTLTTTNAGTSFSIPVKKGVVGVQMTAVNVGDIPPNTAGLVIQGVARGDSDQEYSLDTGDTADLRVTVGDD